MRIIHSISGLNSSSGGPSLSTWSLVSGLRQLGIDAEIVAYRPQRDTEIMISEDDFIHAVVSPRYRRFGYSSVLNNFLKNQLYDVYHGHGLWQYPVHAMAKAATRLHKPYIISPKGMLHPEAMHKSKLLKKIALSGYQRKDLNQATVIHATSMQELEFIRQLGFANPIALVPNSVELPIDVAGCYHNKNKRFGFVGRFVPIKNLEILLTAWAKIEEKFDYVELVLMGDGPKDYRIKLEALCKSLMIKRVVFTGFLTGDARERIFSTLSFLILPSKSENFGMVVPEALAREVPVIASKGTPWEELNTQRAGWWIDIGVEPLVKVLTEAIALPKSERQIMGRNGRDLVRRKYSIKSVSEKMVTLYNWILKGGERPDFVYLSS